MRDGRDGERVAHAGLVIRGTLQVEHGVVNLRGETFLALKADAGEDWAKSHDFHWPVATVALGLFRRDRPYFVQNVAHSA